MDMSPVSQTREAFEWLGGFSGRELEHKVTRMARRVREIAPGCVALSLSVSNGAITFTVMADRSDAAFLDAVQYLDGGPCLSAIHNKGVEATSDLPTDEDRWQMFAKAEALMGISSTLSLPLIEEGQIIGGVNLYGATNDTFDGHHEEIAEACGAAALGAVTNADMGFSSRVRAAATPSRLKSRGRLDLASGLVAQQQGIDLTEAEARIRRAAAHGDVSATEFATFLIDAHAEDLG
jgi:GAF domain-containing protein